VHGYLQHILPAIAADTSAAVGEEQDAPAPLSLTLAPMVGSARDPVPQHVRLHVVEDFAAAALLAIVGGLPHALGCRAVAALTIALAVAHAGYVVLVRPYLDRIEQAFAVFLALAQCALGVAVGIVALRPGRETRAALVAAAWITVVMNVGCYLQMIVLALWEFRKMWRQMRATGPLPGVATMPADPSTADAPLLQIPRAASGAPSGAVAVVPALNGDDPVATARHVNPLREKER
jgi:hypothetical protein